MTFLNKPLKVVIPAGASGIGKTIAEAYLQEGCRVFICDVSDKFIGSFRE